MKEPQGRKRELTSEEGEAFWAELRADYLPFVWFLAARGFQFNSGIAI